MSSRVDNDFDHIDEMSDDDINVIESPTPEVKSKRQKKSTSKVWQFYNRITGEDGKERAQCKKCGAKYLIDSKSIGTSTLNRHVKKCPRNETRDVSQLLLSKSGEVRPNKIEQDVFREKIAIAIIRHDYPFNLVEHEGFRDLCNYLNPDAKPISRNTAKADVLKLYKKHKENLRHKLLLSPGRICLTSDLWTSITTDGYICLTAHFIDEEWILQKRILNFSYMPPPHSGVAIAEKVSMLLNEWGIENKIFSITLDNASANDVCVQVMKNQLSLKNALLSDGRFFHVRCCAHILNIIVQEGLKVLSGAVHKVRETVKYLKGSQVRKIKFLDCVAQMSMKRNKSLRQDVPTRWNSTFLMLESCLLYRPAFCHLQLVDTNYKNCPTSEEWKQIEGLSKFLKVFYDVTNIFSGTKYPTSNLYFHGVWKIQMHLKKEVESADWFINNILRQMQGKFDKYWAEYSPVLAMAIAFDPRYKLQFVEFCYKKLYEESFKVELNRVRGNLISLYEEYSRLGSKESTKSDASVTKLIGISDDVTDDIQVSIYFIFYIKRYISYLSLFIYIL